MKSQLTKSLADHIIAQNSKLKLQVIHLHKNLKLFQTKMMEALDQLISSLSIKTPSYQQILLFDNPYDCLTAFVQQVTKSTSFSLNTSDQNQKLSSQNKRLNNKIKRLEEESVQRITKQEQIIDQLNTQIDQKKQRLKDLEEDYNNLLKTKKTAEKQLNETKQQMKILRLKLYEEQRQKLTEIIVAGKKQMMEFRKSMEMEAYKQEVEFKREIGEKDREIKLLTKNIEQLINSNLTASSDLTVLEKIVKPIRESTQMKDQITALRKEVFLMKNQLREKQSKILGIEGQNADITLSRDNLKSRNERLQIQKKLLIQQLQQKTEQLQTAIKDRKALDLYYSEKWHSEFSKVRQNLQQKYNQNLKTLQKQFQQKKKQIQSQIQAHLQRLRITKNQLTQANTKIIELTQLNQLLNNKINKLHFSLAQSNSVIRQAQRFHTQDLLGKTLQWQLIQQSLTQQLRKWQYSSNKFQTQLNKTISDFNSERTQLLQDKWNQIQSLKKQHKSQTIKLQQQHQQQLNDLENHYSNAKQAIEAGRLAQMVKFEQKQKEINLKHQQQLKQADKLAQAKIHKINEKFNQSQLKYQKLKKQKDEEIHQYNIRLGDLQKVLHERDLQLIARDVELQQFKKMKDTYLAQINSLNLKLNQQSFQKRSLKVQLQSTQTKLDQKSEIIKMLQSKKHKFKQEISQLEAKYKQGFSQLERIHKKALFQCKIKITQLQRLFEKRPIKKQHYIYIQELEKKNLELKTQINLKQAENLIIAEVKEYYEQKAHQNYLPKPRNNQNAFNPQDDPSKAFISTNTLLRNTNSNMREAVKQNQKPVFVKKYSNRRNKLIASAIKLDYVEENQKESQSKEVAQMKRYLSRQHRITETSTALKTRTQPDRSKSCMN